MVGQICFSFLDIPLCSVCIAATSYTAALRLLLLLTALNVAQDVCVALEEKEET